MKIGLSSWAFRYAAGTRDVRPAHPLTHLDLLQRAAGLGAQVVQFCDNMPLDRLDETALALLRDEAQRLGLVLEVGTTGAASENLARFISIARLCGARLVRVVEDMKDTISTVDGFLAELCRVLPDCRQYDITIAIENHFSLGCRDLVGLVQAVDDPHVGICLDTVNSIARLEGWREVTQVLAPYVVSLHLKDAGVEREGTGFHVGGRPLGQGLVDFPAVLHAVRANGRDANVLLEFWMDFVKDEETTLRQEEQWIASSLAYLRQIIN